MFCLGNCRLIPRQNNTQPFWSLFLLVAISISKFWNNSLYQSNLNQFVHFCLEIPVISPTCCIEASNLSEYEHIFISCFTAKHSLCYWWQQLHYWYYHSYFMSGMSCWLDEITLCRIHLLLNSSGYKVVFWSFRYVLDLCLSKYALFEYYRVIRGH